MADDAGVVTVDRDALYSKIARRLLPILMVGYFFAFLDRVNLGFVRQDLERDLGIGSAAFGLAAGVFFISYVLVEIPSNLLMVKIGARRTFSRILVLWGLTAASMALVFNETSLFVLRFLLGAFEAGFAPGMIFYLSLWFPPRRMAAVIGLTMLGSPLGSMIGAPLSAFLILHTDGLANLRGWQWMFILQGLPCLVIAVLVWKLLSDTPQDARWLSPAEKLAVQQDTVGDREALPTRLTAVLRQPRFYLLAFGFFGILAGHYAMGFWLPTILSDHGVENRMTVGLLTALPYACAVAAMLYFGRRSDRAGKRTPYIVTSTTLASACLAAATIDGVGLAVVVAVIAAGTASMFVAYTVFWSIPSSLFSGTAAAGAVALINSVGLLGGFVSPTLIGIVRETTGSTAGGLYVIVALLALSTVLLGFAGRARQSTPAATATP